MIAHVTTVAFQGVEAISVDVQVMVAPGKVGMQIVGLADKAVIESRERVQAALHASGLSMPARRVTVNLAPADLPKEGSHYDMPIALGLMAALGAIPHDALAGYVVLGELSLDGATAPVAGALPAAMGAVALGKGLICPHGVGAEAAWAGSDIEVLAPRSLIALANHFRGVQILSRPEPAVHAAANGLPDLADIKGQESARRALEVAAAGGHNLLMIGPPGAGKSMLAQRLPSILPKLLPRELLEVSMVASLAGEISGGRLSDRRPFRAPHHSATMPALVGGGARVRPGEASLAHCGVLFLDELPEFSPQVLDSLRQPLETGECVVARARAIQDQRYRELGLETVATNAQASSAAIERVAAPDHAGAALLRDASDKLSLSARAYHRVLKVARTLADLDGAETVGRIHLAEAISFRMAGERLAAA